MFCNPGSSFFLHDCSCSEETIYSLMSLHPWFFQARFWVQVMRDLRNGVKLKKVQERQYNPLPIEYQLTPYEMLMDDIRSRRYTLRKVMVCNKENFISGLRWLFSVIFYVEIILLSIIFWKLFLLIKVTYGHCRKFGKYSKLKEEKLQMCNFTTQRKILQTWWCITFNLFSIHFIWTKWVNIEYFVL